jgi:hypothetical protein
MKNAFRKMAKSLLNNKIKILWTLDGETNSSLKVAIVRRFHEKTSCAKSQMTFAQIEELKTIVLKGLPRGKLKRNNLKVFRI